MFDIMFHNTFHETLPIPVYADSRGKHKEIINYGFHGYLNNAQKINSLDKGGLYQWLPGLLFVPYSWN